MNRWLYNTQVNLRRWALSLILLVPGSWRAALARNAVLTRIYEFFDRAKYAEPLAADEPAAAMATQPAPEPAATPPAEPAAVPAPEPLPKRPPAITLDQYDYIPPTRTPAIDRQLRDVRGPVISVLMPVYNTPAKWLRLAIESVQAQWYPYWQLCIVDDNSSLPETLEVLAGLDDPRIKLQRLEQSGNIVGASNAALAMASGDYIALLDHDDELTPDALYQAWRAICDEGAEFIYSDEDKIEESGRFCAPHFKPDFSPEQFLSQNYLCHLVVMRRDLAVKVDGFTAGMDGAQDYDLFLKALERTKQVTHIRRVLYHWRKVPGSTAARFDEKSYAQDAGQRALQAAMQRRGLDANVEAGRFPGTYRVRYAIEAQPLISIIIPFKDEPELLRSCLRAILERSTWTNFEVIGVSNNSELPATFREMRYWSALDQRVRFVEHNVEFNFSEINNFAVREHARGEHIVLMNNDVEMITADWVESLLEFSQRSDVGVVGAMLYYPDERIQHAGVILGIGGVAGHSHKKLPRNKPGYFSRPHLVQNLSAVTAACCMVKRAVYDQVGGLDETNFRIAFNDVDFCLRVREQGYLNVFTPFCEAWHRESVSRGYEDTPEKKRRFAGEVRRFKARHASALAQGDPYYSPYLTRQRETFLLSPTVLQP